MVPGTTLTLLSQNGSTTLGGCCLQSTTEKKTAELDECFFGDTISLLDGHWLPKGAHPPFGRCCFLSWQGVTVILPTGKSVRVVGLVADNPTMRQVALGYMLPVAVKKPD